jgi:alpha-L-rhamnosidase
MKRSHIPVLAILLLCLSGCAAEKSGIEVYDLRCENLTDPHGIGTAIPALSWKLSSSENGAAQRAYQILVASAGKLLNEEDADLWNSGKVKSPSQIMVPYGGKPLSSRSQCLWKVRIWDSDNKVSEWSPSAGFSIGLLDNSDWSASYIGFPAATEHTICPQFFKSFELTGTVEKMILYVNSLGYHEIYLNGKKIGDKVLEPAVSQFSKRSQVITYDITELVNPGRNDLVIWAGKGWYSKGLPGVVFDGPLVRAQIDRYDNGTWSTLIKTDSSWKARNSGYYTTGTWRPHEFGGEVVDANFFLPDMTGPSLDKTSWSNVSVAVVPEHLATAQLTESNIISDTIKPISIIPLGNRTWFVDMGTTLTGWTKIRFSSLKPGQQILLEYCDHLDREGNFVDQKQSDLYIAKGEAGESFRNRFNYHGFRYIRISNLDSEPVADDISCYLIQTGFKAASSFECSDPDMNAIHDMISYTLRCLSLGGYLVDCPQIERLGYGGDGNASTETAQIMFDMAPLYSNWLQAWGDCIRDDGGMPHTAPNPYRAGGGPYWCGFIITASWKTYMNYGDIRVLEKYYPVMQKWLGYAEKYSPAGLLQPWPETDYRSWYLGDWASPEGTDHTNKSSISLVNNCFMSVCYETMNKIAMALGKPDDAELFSAKRMKIIELINSNLYDPIRNIYGSGIQIDMTYPLLAGVVPDPLIETVKKTLRDKIMIDDRGHMATGLVGVPVLTEWAVKSGEANLMYSMLKKREYPGYLYMIDNGATTTWEHWNGARSRIHNCYNGIGAWFYQAVGGIRQEENSPAYGKVIIDLQIPDGITWANTSKETPYGTVSVNWIIENDKFKMSVKIPAGCSARVKTPENIENHKINGGNFNKEGNVLFIDVSSGDYNFCFNLVQ